MVTKLYEADIVKEKCSVLAKIHMVTKRLSEYSNPLVSSVLAKIHMVTKQ